MMQTEGVPRGLLRFLVLKFLSEKPMSGVEIVDRIATETNGRWKPSSGSIYPLLSRLQQRGFTLESSKSESGMRQYTLSNEGQRFFEEQVKLGQKFMEKMQCLAPMFIEGFHLGISDEKLQPAKESAKRLLQIFIELETKKNQLTKENIVEITRILDDSGNKLIKIIHENAGDNQQLH